MKGLFAPLIFYSEWATSWRKHHAISHTAWFIHLADVGVIRSTDLRFRVGHAVAESGWDLVADDMFFSLL